MRRNATRSRVENNGHEPVQNYFRWIWATNKNIHLAIFWQNAVSALLMQLKAYLQDILSTRE